jgi:hypothetical protein
MAGQLLVSLLFPATPLLAIDFGYNFTGIGSPGLLDKLSAETQFVQCLLFPGAAQRSSKPFSTTPFFFYAQGKPASTSINLRILQFQATTAFPTNHATKRSLHAPRIPQQHRRRRPQRPGRPRRLLHQHHLRLVDGAVAPDFDAEDLDSAALRPREQRLGRMRGSAPEANSGLGPPVSRTSCFCGRASVSGNELGRCYAWIASWMADTPVMALSASYESLCGGLWRPLLISITRQVRLVYPVQEGVSCC